MAKAKASRVRAPKILGSDGVLTVRRTVFGQESEEQRPLQIRPFVADAAPGAVTVRLSRTINLGNYNSAKVEVGLTVPGYREELVPLYHEVFDTVAGLVNDEVAKIEQDCGVARKPVRSDKSVEELL